MTWRTIARTGLVVLPLWVGCAVDDLQTPDPGKVLFLLEVPYGWPDPLLREDNPLTVASVELGKALFFDERLSLGRGIACASCHLPARAFSDTVALSIGVHGQPGSRNAPSLANVAYHRLLDRDGGAPTLEQQVFIPLYAEDEMDSDPQQVVELLKDDPHIADLSGQAYDRPFDLYVLTRALANYQRTLISGYSRYDRHLNGDDAAMDAQERRGMRLFFGEARCSACHSGNDFSDHGFHNIGTSMDDAADHGRQRITLSPADRGKFKTPTLRNVALTAPYMHDGSMGTLEEVIEHFNEEGLANPNKDPLLTPLHLTPAQKEDLAAFLRALTDERSLDQVE